MNFSTSSKKLKRNQSQSSRRHRVKIYFQIKQPCNYYNPFQETLMMQQIKEERLIWSQHMHHSQMTSDKAVQESRNLLCPQAGCRVVRGPVSIIFKATSQIMLYKGLRQGPITKLSRTGLSNMRKENQLVSLRN
jgi:hypothetical protein